MTANRFVACMGQIARSMLHGFEVVACLVAAACSPPDWPEDAPAPVTGPSSGGSGSTLMPANNASSADPVLTPVTTGEPVYDWGAETPALEPVNGLGAEAPAPVNEASDRDGSGEPSNESDAGAEPIELTPDAGELGSSLTPPERTCDGALLAGVCWYLGAAAASCEEACAAHGGWSPESAATIGTIAQGGSPEGCAAVLQALDAFDGSVSIGRRLDGRGLGCHVYSSILGTAETWWLSTPAFSPESSIASARVVCGCMR